jgi:hypothetical protein
MNYYFIEVTGDNSGTPYGILWDSSIAEAVPVGWERQEGCP